MAWSIPFGIYRISVKKKEAWSFALEELRDNHYGFHVVQLHLNTFHYFPVLVSFVISSLVVDFTDKGGISKFYFCCCNKISWPKQHDRGRKTWYKVSDYSTSLRKVKEGTQQLVTLHYCIQSQEQRGKNVPMMPACFLAHIQKYMHIYVYKYVRNIYVYYGSLKPV